MKTKDEVYVVTFYTEKYGKESMRVLATGFADAARYGQQLLKGAVVTSVIKGVEK